MRRIPAFPNDPNPLTPQRRRPTVCVEGDCHLKTFRTPRVFRETHFGARPPERSAGRHFPALIKRTIVLGALNSRVDLNFSSQTKNGFSGFYRKNSHSGKAPSRSANIAPIVDGTSDAVTNGQYYKNQHDIHGLTSPITTFRSATVAEYMYLFLKYSQIQAGRLYRPRIHVFVQQEVLKHCVSSS